MTLNVFCSGQSNALGGDGATGGRAMSYISNRVAAWNNPNPPSGNNGSAFVPLTFNSAPLGTGGDYQNFGAWFCHFAAVALGQDVRYVLVAEGGQGIKQWDSEPDNPPYMLAASIAAYGASGLAPANVYLWHQGERDRAAGDNTDPAVYKTRHLQMVADLKTAGVLASDAIILVGGLIHADAKNIDLALRELAAENADYHYIEASGLTSHDAVHFDGPSMVQMGRRYCNAYAKASGFARAPKLIRHNGRVITRVLRGGKDLSMKAGLSI